MDILEENLEMQREERLAIGAIFGDSILQLDEYNSSDTQAVYILTINVDHEGHNDMNTSVKIQLHLRSPRKMVLRLFFPCTYPSNDMPVFEVTSVYCGNTKIDSLMVNTIQQGLHALFQPGQVVLFDWIQWLEDYLGRHVMEASSPPPPPSAADDLTDNNNNNSDRMMDLPATIDKSGDTNGSMIMVPSIFSSKPLVDRKSIFVAHVAPVKSADQVKKVVYTLLENKKIARATHNIIAYRINLPGDIILQDNDDDGETAAGGRLMHLLQILDVKDVVVVVSRWFDGILLGPDRFKDINNCARQALEECGYLQNGQKKKNKKVVILV